MTKQSSSDILDCFAPLAMTVLMDFLVTETEKGNRLDHFLVTHLPSISRSAIQKRIKDGAVTVNEKKVSVHHFLRAGDRVVVVQEGSPTFTSPSSRGRKPKAFSPPAEQEDGWSGGSVPVLYEDDDIVAVEKPAGLVVHGGPGITGPTLVDVLVAMRPGIAAVGDDPARPGIIHRLDADVSGVMVIAKTQRAFDALKQQFKERTVRKTYMALVVGRVAKDVGTIDFVLGRSRRRGRMAARPIGGEGKEARTLYEVVTRYPNATLMHVKIETGRTHQIRAHFHALGHPIAGDARYRIKGHEMSHPPPRLFLHATEITFQDMMGESRTVRSELPEELERYLFSLGK